MSHDETLKAETMTIEIEGEKVAICIGDSTIQFEGDEPQTVPRLWNRDDYRYSHGGRLYQKACEAFWDIEDSE